MRVLHPGQWVWHLVGIWRLVCWCEKFLESMTAAGGLQQGSKPFLSRPSPWLGSAACEQFVALCAQLPFWGPSRVVHRSNELQLHSLKRKRVKCLLNRTGNAHNVIQDLFLVNENGGNNIAEETDRLSQEGSLDSEAEEDLELYRITGTLQAGIVSCRRPGAWICFAGGERQKAPRVWKKQQTRGSSGKAIKLIQIISTLSDVKEEIYGTLDAWSAWELDFPLVAVKKALKILRDKWQWKRVIQVSKWMLSKGYGKTMATYYLLLQALEKEGRIEEAEEIFKNVFQKYLDGVPRSHFALMMSIYKRAGMYDKLLDVFADMEELRVRPDIPIVDMVAEVYTKVGMSEKSEKVKAKYPPQKWEYKYVRGKRVKISTKRLYANKTSENAEPKEENVVEAEEPVDGSEDDVDEEEKREQTGGDDGRETVAQDDDTITKLSLDEALQPEYEQGMSSKDDIREMLLRGDAVGELVLLQAENSWLQNEDREFEVSRPQTL